MQRAEAKRLPELHKESARRNPGEAILLPTGAKLIYQGRRYWVYGYTPDDTRPYLG